MLVHIVFFKLKKREQEVLDKAVTILRGMEGRVPQIQSIEVGIDVLQSDRSFDIALTARFQSLQDMQDYQVHPVHQEVKKFMTSVSERTVSVDYEA